MKHGSTAGRLVAVALLAGCGSSTTAASTGDASVKQHVLRGVDHIRVTRDRHELRAKLARVVAGLRGDRPATTPARRGRALALLGFQVTRKGLAYQLAFYENDSGNLPAATRDAALADRYLKRGANRLRAAGRALGIRVGTLNGY